MLNDCLSELCNYFRTKSLFRGKTKTYAKNNEYLARKKINKAFLKHMAEGLMLSQWNKMKECGDELFHIKWLGNISITSGCFCVACAMLMHKGR